MEKHYVTFVAEFETSAVPGLSIDMEILGGKVTSTFIGNAVDELYELKDLNEQHERKLGIATMYELARSLKDQSMHSIVEALYDAGYRNDFEMND
ncbi:hypothetical protein ACQZND_000057 [Vibrio alginolyticus]